MLRIFDVRKMSGIRNCCSFNRRIQFLILFGNERTRSLFFAGNDINAGIRRFNCVVDADIQILANIAGIEIFGVGTTFMRGFIISIYKCIGHVKRIIK